MRTNKMEKRNALLTRSRSRDNRDCSRRNQGLAEKKMSERGKRVFTDPSFHGTRETMLEFGRAGSSGKLLRNAVGAFLRKCSDRQIVCRLTGEMFRVLEADITNERGNRRVSNGEIALLQGFEFNKNAELLSVLKAPFIPRIDRATGILQVDIDPFSPLRNISAPASARQFCLFIAGCSVDFTNGSYTTSTAATDFLPLNEIVTDPIHLSCNVTVHSMHPLFLVMGIEFMEVFNGERYALTDTSYNAMAIVKILSFK